MTAGSVRCDLQVQELEDGTFTIWNVPARQPFRIDGRDMVGLNAAEAATWGPTDFVEIDGFLLGIRNDERTR